MEFLEAVTLRQVFDFIVGAIAVISILVEKSKKLPFHPWSFLFSQLGKALNKDVRAKLDELDERQKANTTAIKELKEDMEHKFQEKAADDDQKEAKRLRARIIDFADSCRLHQHHTKTAFENIMRDYDDYVEYCEAHDIPNHFIDEEYEYITEVYRTCQRENRFL